MKDWMIYVGVICMLSMVLGVTIGGYYVYDKHVACPAFGYFVQLDVKYNFFAGGCFVKAANGQWVRRENYYNAIPQK